MKAAGVLAAIFGAALFTAAVGDVYFLVTGGVLSPGYITRTAILGAFGLAAMAVGVRLART
jgi:hypothetical protein